MFTLASASAIVRAPVSARASKPRRGPAPAPALGGGGGNGNGRKGGGGGGGGGGDSGSGSDGFSFRGRGPRRVLGLGLAAAGLASSVAPDAALAGKAPTASDIKKQVLQIAGMDAPDFAALFSKELGISGAVGVGVGLMAKAAAKTAFIMLASVYAFIRWLELNDIVDVKYKNLEKLVGKTVMIADLNNDGKIDAKDLELAKAKAVGFFGTALPSASGLAAGIMIGLKI